MFTGREYQSEFSEICQSLASKKSSETEVKNALIGLEWVLWEAVRGALFGASVLISFSFVFLISYALEINLRERWTTGLFVMGIAVAVALLIYGILRLSLFFGLTKHLRSHRFGKLDFKHDLETRTGD